MRKRKLLITCLLSLIGALQMTAQTTLTEDFNSVTIQKDGVNVSGWQTGNGLSNGWYLIGTGGIYTDDDYSTGYYGLISDGDGGKCIGYSYGTTNTAYLAVPDKLTGEVTFKARSTTTNSRYLSYVQVSLYEVNDDNTIGSLIETVKPSTTSWSSFSIDLGTEGKKVAVYMIRAAIDDFSATIYEDGAEVKAMAVTAFEALNTNVNADADGNYVAEFAVTVENKGNVDLTSADGAAISLLDASKNVIATMPVDVALDELVIVTINYEGTATQDGEVTFYVREDLSGKEFATPVTITVQLAGARFAIDVIEGSRHDLGFVAQDGTAEKTFTITNSGNADLDVSFAAPDFLIVPSPLAVGADSSDEFSIGLSTETQGIKNGIVSLTTNAVDVKSFEFIVSGYVYPADAEHLDFAELPDNWTASGFTFADGLATAGYGTNTLTSPAILFQEGYSLGIKARFDSSVGEFEVKGSSDGGETWTAYSVVFSAESSQFTGNEFATVELTDIPSTVNMLQISGQRFTIDDIAGFNYNDNAPRMAVTKDGAAVSEDDFGTLTASSSHTYTVANIGTGTLNVAVTSDSDDFTVSPATLDVDGGESATFTVTFNFDEENFGEKNATITVTPQNEGLAAVSFNVKALTKDPNIWDEDFEGGEMPAYWSSEGGWYITKPTYSGNNGTYMAYIRSYQNPKALTTPRLLANAGDVLTFYVGMEYDDEPMKIEYSADDRATWNVIEESVTESGEISFTAPADGLYYLRFTATYAMLDNFIGFKLAIKDHDMAITASNIPATGKQFEEYTATVTVQELTGKDEVVGAMLYVDDNLVSEIYDVDVEANGSQTLTLSFLPDTAGENLPVYIEVLYEGGTLKTEEVAVTFESAYTLTENGGNVIAEGSYDVVNLDYTIASQWNTICLPFKVTDLSLLGEGTEAYELAGFKGGLLQFSQVTELQAGYPYLLKITALPEQLSFYHVTIYSFTTEAQSDTKDGVTFFGSYEPVAAPGMDGMYGVTESGTIARGGSGASLLGLRGYFQLPDDATASEYGMMIGGETVTAIRGIDAPALSGDVYDLSGRKVTDTKSLQPGIYVTNGKKVVVK